MADEEREVQVVSTTHNLKGNNSTKIGADTPALALVQELSLLSFVPLVAAYWKLGPISIRYNQSTSRGVWMAKLLFRIGFASEHPVQISDTWRVGQVALLIDTQFNYYWNIESRGLKMSQAMMSQIDDIARACLPRLSRAHREIYTGNVTKSLVLLIQQVLVLCNAAQWMANEAGVPPGKVVVVSPNILLFRRLSLDSSTESAHPVMLNQPTIHNSVMWAAGRSLRNVWRSLTRVGRTLRVVSPGNRVGATAAWGLDPGGLHDLFWWDKGILPADRLAYLFDRQDIQPTLERVQQAEALGVRPIAMNRHALGDAPREVD